MFTLFVSKHPAGFSLNVGQHRGQQGRPPCLRRHRPDDPGPHLRLDLSVGMVFVMANCLASTLVVGTPVEAARACWSCWRVAPLRRAQRPHRRLRTPAADHRDAGDRRDLLRRRALAAARTGRRRQRGPRRLHHWFARQRGSVLDRPSPSRGVVHLDSLPAVGAGPGGLRRRLVGAAHTCRASRSPERSSWPTCWPASSPRSPASCSPASLIRARQTRSWAAAIR